MAERYARVSIVITVSTVKLNLNRNTIVSSIATVCNNVYFNC